MNNIIKICQNCKQKFELDEADSSLLQKLQMPGPIECFDCRQQRLLAARNERKLYQNECRLCHKKILSLFSRDKPYTIYCPDCYHSDAWDGLEYGQEFDFSKTFFEQFDELLHRVPLLSLNILGTNINSEFTNDNYKLKNCYLVFDGEQAEDTYYGETFFLLRDCMDFLFLTRSELCYECTNCENCYSLNFSRFCKNCSESRFLRDCRSCKNCFGCVNLTSKQCYIFNQPHSKNEYEEFMQKFQTGGLKALEEMKKQFEEFEKTQPVKYMHGHQNESVSGDFLSNSKNAFECYDCNDLKDCKYCTNIVLGGRDLYHVNVWGDNLERAFNSSCIGAGAFNIICSFYTLINVSDCAYCMYCMRSNKNLFGCIGLRHKEYCILNRKYSKEDYFALREKIIEHMKKTGEWGQFFPVWMSVFGYNETIAMDYYRLTKEQAIEKGYKWHV